MKPLLFLILILFTLPLFAPIEKAIYIPRSEGVNIYDPLIKAIVQVESGSGKYLYNEKENAVGHFQIRQVRIDHYNRETGLNHALNDCYDYNLSREIFLYFAHGKSYERAAREWNGSGPMTDHYWEKVKQELKNN